MDTAFTLRDAGASGATLKVILKPGLWKESKGVKQYSITIMTHNYT